MPGSGLIPPDYSPPLAPARWSLQSPTYSRAVLDGKAEADCGMRYRECSHSPVSMAYGVMRMLSAMY